MRSRAFMRNWVLTGNMELPEGADADPEEAAKPPEKQAKIEVAKGVKVSQEQMDAFSELGGNMQRRRRRPG